MLKKKNKLPIQLFPGKRGKVFKSPYFTLKVFTAERDFSRFGVTISAKTAPKAVKRNQLKRAAFNFFKDSDKKLLVADYWITVNSAAVGLSKESFIEELRKALTGSV